MIQTSRVAFTESTSYDIATLQDALSRTLDLIDLPLEQCVRPGDRVLIKPYLRHGSVRLPESRMVSHPALIEALVGLVRDCGGRPILGDEGSRHLRNAPLHPDSVWLHLLASRCDAELVSFAKAGGRIVESGIERPTCYLLSQAVLDADTVISLGNAQPHPSLVWSGSVKNMFNAVIGAGNDQISSLLKDAERISSAIADVCRLSRPTLSFLDMTTICPGRKQELWRPGLIGASTDPVALDSVAVRILGWCPSKIPSLTSGERLGLGRWRQEQISLHGLHWEDLPICPVPQPEIAPSPPGSTLQNALRTLNKTHLRPRPVLDTTRCKGVETCGDCIQVCPIQVIHTNSQGLPRIDYQRCADCMVCADACQERAIRPSHRSWVAALRWPQAKLHQLWRRSKTGHTWSFGPVALHWHLKASSPVRPAPRRPSPNAENIIPSMKRIDQPPRESDVALIVGAGPGLGSALARRFARAGMDVAIIARDGLRLDGLVQELQALGIKAHAYACDITQDKQVTDTVHAICSEMGVPNLAIYNVEQFGPGHVVDIETPAFLECWQVNCFGAFLVGREVARAMLTRSRGTLIFTGATAALRGKDGYANMAVGKWGQRALAQCMARELGPKGIHVAHVVIDGGILKPTAEPFMHERMLGLYPDEIAENYLALHRQHPSAWTQELDLRPWLEKF